MNMIIRSLALPALALAAATACTTPSAPTALPASTTARPAVASSAGFPIPPPYTVEIDGNQIKVSTGSAAETDLLNTYNTVAREHRSKLPDGGYWIRINCAGTSNRLANGTLGIGQKGIAVIESFGKYEGPVPGAHCP